MSYFLFGFRETCNNVALCFVKLNFKIIHLDKRKSQKKKTTENH